MVMVACVLEAVLVEEPCVQLEIRCIAVLELKDFAQCDATIQIAEWYAIGVLVHGKHWHMVATSTVVD
jgi:hypothetical protein